jgi:tetratricopeptide (TPR) repeat protein
VSAGIHERARLLLNTGREAEALRLLRSAVATDPHDLTTWGLMSRAHLGLQEFQQALDTAGRVVRGWPEGTWGHILASCALSGLGRRQEALAAAREAVRLDPSNHATHLQVAVVADDMKGQGALAWEAARRAVELAPLDPDTHATMGSVAITAKRRDVAERALLEALRLDPQHVQARHDLGVVQLSQGSMSDAARSFVDTAIADPRQTVARRNLDVLVLKWLQRTHIGLWVLWVAERVPVALADDTRGFAVAPIVLSLLGIGVLVWWTRRTVVALGGDLRRALWRVLRASWVASIWFGCVALAAVALLVMAWSPEPFSRAMALFVAGGALLVGCLVSWIGVAAGRIRPRT